MKEFLTRLLNALGIDPGEGELTEERAIDLIVEKRAQALADEGVLQGKLRTGERPWFLNEARKGGSRLAVMEAFLRHRKTVPGVVLRYRRLSDGRIVTERDDLQERINQQMGVSFETFIKYNPSPAH